VSNIAFARRVSLWLQILVLAACPAVANDPAAEVDLAMKLAQAGETTAAVEKLENALKTQPQLVANRWSAVEQAFRQANKTDELYAAVEKMDLKAFRQTPWIVGNMLQYMFQDEKQKD
jgi:lipopolysaccharide biosynthesis regulator YciM